MHESLYAFEQSPAFAQLVRAASLNELGPGKCRRDVCEKIADLAPSELFAPLTARDKNAARACVAGLLLLYDGLDESHTISQELEDATGSYWHGIMHRREPDYGNAKYWFARVRRHPVFPAVAAAAQELARDSLERQAWPKAKWLLNQESWQAEVFVDLCQAARSAGPAADLLCRHIQRKECELLLDFCFQAAIRD